MNAVLATEAFEALSHVDHALDVGIGGDHVSQLASRLVPVDVLRVLLEAVLQRRVAAHNERRHRFGDLVAHCVRVPEHTSGIAYRGPCLDLTERDDLSDAVTAIHVSRVTDHVVSVAGIKVHVDVRHRYSGRVQETLEQQVVLNRIEIGDPECVGHRTPGCRPTTRSDPDVIVASERDEVPSDEEVRREPHVVDNAELIVEPFGDLRPEFMTPTLLCAFVGEVTEVLGVGGEAFGERELGQLRVAKLDLDVASLSDPERVVARLRYLCEESPHLAGRLDVMPVAVKLEAIGVREERSGLHAQQGVVGLRVVLVGVVRVVGGEDRRLNLLGNLQQLRIGGSLLGDPLVLQFDEEVVAAVDVLESSRMLKRRVLVADHERLQHVAAEAARGGDDPLGVFGHRLPVGPRFVVKTVEVRLGGEMDEVLVADVVLGHHDGVVVELLAAADIAA